MIQKGFYSLLITNQFLEKCLIQEKFTIEYK